MAALRMTMLLLLMSVWIAAVGSANGQQIVGVGNHTVNPDGRTVTLAEGWNIAPKGSQPKGYQQYNCPIAVNGNGDITVMYTNGGGGRTGCGLDLIAKKPVADTIQFTIATTSDPNKCAPEGGAMSLAAAYNLLPFIHSVDNQEFQRMSKGGGWFGPDKGNCSDAEKCKNKEGKYQCRKYTTYEFGWSILGLRALGGKPIAIVKPVAENVLVTSYDESLKANYFTFPAQFQPQTLIVTSNKFEVEGTNRNDEGIRPYFKCTPQQPDAKLYPVISWTIGKGTPLNGRHLLFFGLLAQDLKRDYFTNSEEGLPRCDFSLTFDGQLYELLHQEFVPTPTIPTTTGVVVGIVGTTTNQQSPTNSNIVDVSSNNSSVPTPAQDGDNTLMWILIGCGSGALVLLAAVGVLIYCMCFTNGKDEEEDKDGEEESEEQEADAERETTLTSVTTTKTGAATAFGRTAITAVPPTKGDDKTTKVDKKTKATKVTKADQKAKAAKATKTTAATKVTKTVAPTKKTKVDKTYQNLE